MKMERHSTHLNKRPKVQSSVYVHPNRILEYISSTPTACGLAVDVCGCQGRDVCTNDRSIDVHACGAYTLIAEFEVDGDDVPEGDPEVEVLDRGVGVEGDGGYGGALAVAC